MEDHEGHLNQPKINQKLCQEKEHSPLSLKESKWILRQKHSEFLKGVKVTAKEILGSEDRYKSEKAGFSESH